MPLADCAISTAWRSSKIRDARELVDAMKETGLSTLELEFRLSPETFGEIKKNRAAWGIDIRSLHAVCPSPEGRKRGAEIYLVSDTDEESRRRGVAHVADTIRNAADIGAKAIVLHCGRVPMDEPIYEMMKLYDAGKTASLEAYQAHHRMLLERMPKVKKSFAQLLKSLDFINGEAVRLGIAVGLENRYYFGELPNLDEFGVIFNTFDGGNLGYWHDTGHAHVQETLFGVSQKMMLDTFSERLIGIHLHDAKGYTDHGEPGGGDIDFDMIRTFLKPDTIRVIEMNHRVSLEEAKRGVAFLREKGICGGNGS